MYSGIYSVNANLTSWTGAKTLVQIKAATKQLEIIRVEVTQTSSTTSAQTQVQLLRLSSTCTVTSFTPLLMDPAFAAATAVGGTSATGVNATAEGTAGDVLFRSGFNILNGFLWLPVPEERIKVPVGGFFGVKMPDAVTSGTYNVNVIFGEC